MLSNLDYIYAILPYMLPIYEIFWDKINLTPQVYVRFCGGRNLILLNVSFNNTNWSAKIKKNYDFKA